MAFYISATINCVQQRLGTTCINITVIFYDLESAYTYIRKKTDSISQTDLWGTWWSDPFNIGFDPLGKWSPVILCSTGTNDSKVLCFSFSSYDPDEVTLDYRKIYPISVHNEQDSIPNLGTCRLSLLNFSLKG